MSRLQLYITLKDVRTQWFAPITLFVTITRYHQQHQLQVLRSALRVGIIVDMNRKNKTAK
jgi:hypothetical protein